MANKYIGAIDQGTTSTRFLVFDVAGNKIISYSSEELKAGDLHPVSWRHQWNNLTH